MARRRKLELIGLESILEDPKRFYDTFYARLDRQGPGSDRMTEIVASLTRRLPMYATIVDVQCGAGRQTMALHRVLKRRTFAIDNRAEVIARLQESLKADYELQKDVTALVADPDRIPLGARSIDMIWSENFVGPFGLERALDAWIPKLRPNAFVVFSVCTWLKEEHTDDAYINRRFGYMRTVAEVLRTLERHKFLNVAHIIQPDDCWTDSLYIPMALRMQELSAEERAHPTVKAFCEERHKEIESYIRHHDEFRNVFFVAMYEGPTAAEETPIGEEIDLWNEACDDDLDTAGLPAPDEKQEA